MNNRLINTKVAGGGGGCTDIVDNYDPFGGNGLALYQLNGDANDVSGNYNGTASNVTYGTGVFGQAGVFNGSNSIIDLGDHNVFSPSVNALSLSCWIKTTGTLDFIFSKGGGGGYEYGLLINGSGQIELLAYTLSASSSVSINTSSAYNDGNWHQVVAIYDPSGNFKIYVDGSQQATSSSSLSMGNGSNALILGKKNDTSLDFFNGSIDQVRIFNTALTPLEVEALYKEELCICDGTVDTLDILGDGSCIATYQLDGNANDLSGNYSGTPVGGLSYGVGEFDLGSYFDGSSYIELPSGNPFDDTNTIKSISAWVKYTTGENYPLTISSSASNSQFFQVLYNGSVLAVYTRNASASNEAYHTASWSPDNNWHHIVWQNSTENEIYLDGEKQTLTFRNTGSSTNSSWISYPTYGTPLARIGLNRVVLPAPGVGGIDQIRLFNKVLDQNDVNTLFAESACTKVTRTAGITQILGDSSCIAYYKLDGTADDETGTYNGTFTNPNYGNGEFDLAGVFNGSSNGIKVDGFSINTSSFSISLWVKADSVANPVLRIKTNYNIPLSIQGYSIYLPIANSTVYALQDIAYDDNSWNHLVVTNSNVFLNGTNVHTFSGSLSNQTYGTDVTGLVLGNGGWNFEYPFTGSIDQVRVFNKAVSPSEVTTLYNEGI